MRGILRHLKPNAHKDLFRCILIQARLQRGARDDPRFPGPARLTLILEAAARARAG
jgi:hypothetical protein